MSQRLFTSESVTEGHPDKIADAISDAVLDSLLSQDKKSRVAVETLITTGQVHVAGEVTTGAELNSDVIDRIGHMMEPFTFGLQKTSDGALGTKAFQQLHFVGTHPVEKSVHPLAFNGFFLVGRGAQEAGVQRLGLGQRPHRDPKMLNTRQIGREFGFQSRVNGCGLHRLGVV